MKHYSEWIDSSVKRFSNIGGTFAISPDGDIYNAHYGVAVSDGMIQWTIPINADVHSQLSEVFTSIARIASMADVLSTLNNRIFGIWLDFESNPPCYLIESGRLFVDDIGAAFDYAAKHNQRYMFDLSVSELIPCVTVGNVIDGSTGDDFLIE